MHKDASIRVVHNDAINVRSNTYFQQNLSTHIRVEAQSVDSPPLYPPIVIVFWDPLTNVTFKGWDMITPELVSRWRNVILGAPLTETVANRAIVKLWPLTPRLSPTVRKAQVQWLNVSQRCKIRLTKAIWVMVIERYPLRFSSALDPLDCNRGVCASN